MASARPAASAWPPVIALYSYGYQAGKDTTGGFFVDWAKQNGQECLCTAFAWTMKVVCAESLGIEGTEAEKVAAVDRIKLALGPSVLTHLPRSNQSTSIIVDVVAITGRDFIINLSESLKARVDPYIWIKLVMERAKDLGSRGFHVVTDLRFKDEAIAVRDMGGVVIEVWRPDAAKNAGGKRSEEGIPPELVDYRIENTGSLEDLRLATYTAADRFRLF